jgi:hypothetical protein
MSVDEFMISFFIFFVLQCSWETHMLVAGSMGNIECSLHKSWATTQTCRQIIIIQRCRADPWATPQTCRQITLTGDAEIHVREKPDQSY